MKPLSILFIAISFFSNSVVIAQNVTAKISKVSLQASGLTCSMCSNSINKALKSLDFVDKVDANIKTSTFDIFFKPSSNVDFDKLKKKVEGAGFSVAQFIALIHFSNFEIKNNSSLEVDGNTIQFVNAKTEMVNGDRAVKLLDKGFISSKEAKKSLFAASANGKVYHASI